MLIHYFPRFYLTELCFCDSLLILAWLYIIFGSLTLITVFGFALFSEKCVLTVCSIAKLSPLIYSLILGITATIAGTGMLRGKTWAWWIGAFPLFYSSGTNIFNGGEIELFGLAVNIFIIRYFLFDSVLEYFDIDKSSSKAQKIAILAIVSLVVYFLPLLGLRIFNTTIGG